MARKNYTAEQIIGCCGRPRFGFPEARRPARYVAGWDIGGIGEEVLPPGPVLAGTHSFQIFMSRRRERLLIRSDERLDRSNPSFTNLPRPRGVSKQSAP